MMKGRFTDQRWKELLRAEYSKAYFKNLIKFVAEERKSCTIFPKEEKVFNAFNLTPFKEVKVVIIGQDPYHSFEHQGELLIPHANGLAFSISKEARRIPPSLKNMMKELNDDLCVEHKSHGDLSSWAKQGVLLMNATLTVRKHEAGSHQKQGWETFTDAIIKKLSTHKSGLVFLLWGKSAQQKEGLIDGNKHYILKAAHPSPFSAYRGFFKCKHFSKTNNILTKQGYDAINWELK